MALRVGCHNRVTQIMHVAANNLCRRMSRHENLATSAVIGLIDAYVSASGVDALTALSVQTTYSMLLTGRRFCTVLHLSCEYGLVDVFDHILGLCCDPAFLNLRMDDGATALFLAQLQRPGRSKTETQVLHMTRRLVEGGADCFILRSVTGCSPLYAACESDFLGPAKLLLAAMLIAEGAEGAEGGEMSARVEARLETIAYMKEGKGVSLLHASVCGGWGSGVCRWLMSPECAMLWPERSLVHFVNYCPCDYGFTALQEALWSDRLNLRCVSTLYECLQPHQYSAQSLVETLLSFASKKSGERLTGVAEDVSLIEFLYEKASSLPDFTSLKESQTLVHVVGWFGSNRRRHKQLKTRLQTTFPDVACNLRCAAAIESLTRRLIGRYPALFTDTHVHACRRELMHDVRLGVSGGEASRLSVMILLDWYPCDAAHLFKLLDPRLHFDTRIVGQYASKLLRRDSCAGELDEAVLYAAMGHVDGEMWASLVLCVHASNSNARMIFRTLVKRLTRSDVVVRQTATHAWKYNVNDVRFLVWAYRMRFGVRLSLADVLYNCSPEISPSVFKHMVRLHPPWTKLGSLSDLRFGAMVHPRLLGTVIWCTDITPTQLIARIFMQDVNESGSTFTKAGRNEILSHARWVFNVRHMVKERSSSVTSRRTSDRKLARRMVLGPRLHNRRAQTMPLPLRVTRTLLELLWEGTEYSLDLKGSN